MTIRQDIRQVEEILAHPELQALIDFDEPVGVLFVAVRQFIPDEENPSGKG
ncbi:MAG: hypothetical protein JWN52_7850 [Actinomycetia bacterium]|nr:hypothetical protein [Actinomycetes bacterium]